MKKTYILILGLLSASALLLGGCSRELPGPEGNGRVLTAHIGDGTRVTFNENTGKFAWSDPDEIALHFSSGAYENVTVKASGVFTLDLATGVTQDGYGVYPSNIVDAANYGNPTLNLILPASYDVTDAAGMGDWYPVPMVAVNTPHADDIWFYHAGAVARLVMDDVPTGTATIVVDMGKQVTGTFTVENPATVAPTIKAEDSAANTTVTFALATPLASETDGFILNVPLPTGTYNILHVSMQNGSGSELKAYESDRSRLFHRARGRKIHLPWEEPEEEEFDFSGYAGAYVDDTSWN